MVALRKGWYYDRAAILMKAYLKGGYFDES